MQRENKASSVPGRISKLKVSAGKRPLIPPTFRDVAQPGSASALGAEGPRFESWYPDKKGFLQQENRQNRCSKERVGSSPTEEETPDGEIGRHVGQKNGNPLTFKDCYSKNYIALLTPWSSVRVRPGSFEDR